MKKRLLCLTLALLLVTFTAFAAPMRDEQSMAVTPDENMRDLVSLYAGAAILRDVPSLSAGETPSDALVEGVMLLGLKQVVLPRASGDTTASTATETLSALQTHYASLFVTGEYVMPETPSCPCITREGDKLTFNFDGVMEEEMVGARIYSTVRQGDDIKVLADVYITPSYFGSVAENVPEDSIIWETTMTLLLRADSASPYGYRLSAYETAPSYLDGAMAEWQEIGADSGLYTALIPSIFKPAGEGRYQTEDGTATLALALETDARSEKLDYYLNLFAQENPTASLNVEADLGFFIGVDQTEFTLYIVPEESGQVCKMTMTFPAERAAEFTFYGELIRNTFSLDGLSNG